MCCREVFFHQYLVPVVFCYGLALYLLLSITMFSPGDSRVLCLVPTIIQGVLS